MGSLALSWESFLAAEEGPLGLWWLNWDVEAQELLHSDLCGQEREVGRAQPQTWEVWCC